MTVLLMTPPMTQLNTPYPATAYLTGFLRSRGHSAVQRDPAIELFLEMMTTQGLDIMRQHVEKTLALHCVLWSRLWRCIKSSLWWSWRTRQSQIPIPGNMLGALRIAQACKNINPDLPVVMGENAAFMTFHWITLTVTMKLVLVFWLIEQKS